MRLFLQKLFCAFFGGGLWQITIQYYGKPDRVFLFWSLGGELMPIPAIGTYHEGYGFVMGYNVEKLK